jgi:small subunit ribosomal protein S20
LPKPARPKNQKSAVKDLRKSRASRLRNQSTRSAIKTYVKKTRTVIAAATTPEELEKAGVQFRETESFVDRAAKRGIIHANAAARRKSRLAKRLNAAQAGAAA